MGRSRGARRQHGRWLVALATAAAAASLATGASAAKAPKTEFRALKPVADTYVTAARPRTNFGSAAVLRVDGAPEATAYLRFRLKGIPGEITSVTLLLRPVTAGRASYAVRQVGEGHWRERRLTYVNAPEPSLRYASSKPIRRGVWSAIDVTSFVASAGSEEIGLAITTRGSRELSFGSRESQNGPRLVVRFERPGHLNDRVLDALGRR
ncbi:MAG TPA: DNRLRE domain-containing protein [Gaiellaceae bacterium]